MEYRLELFDPSGNCIGISEGKTLTEAIGYLPSPLNGDTIKITVNTITRSDIGGPNWKKYKSPHASLLISN